MKKILIAMLAAIVLTACSKADMNDEQKAEGNVRLLFVPSMADTRGEATALSAWCSKLNVMVFDQAGNKMLSQVKTQTRDESRFGDVSIQLTEGVYTVVAVGHSSVKSATIKSPTVVQFTASDGEKLTDTFCYCGKIEVGDEPVRYDLTMLRATAMIQFCLTDEQVPEGFARMKLDYTGGSANFNPTTLEGITKSTQTESRMRTEVQTYQAYTFPYMATTGKVRLTLSALDGEGNVLKQRVLEEIPVTRNRITTYTGKFFDDGGGEITQSGFGFVVDADWEGEDNYTF